MTLRRCARCGAMARLVEPYGGSPNLMWLACTSCGHREAVFASEGEWVDWDCPVKMVGDTPIIPFEMLRGGLK